MSFEFHAPTKATHKIKRTVCDYRNADFDGLRGALEALNLCNLITMLHNRDTEESPLLCNFSPRGSGNRTQDKFCSNRIVPKAFGTFHDQCPRITERTRL